MAEFDFGRVIAPIAPDVFFRDIYERRHLVVHRDDPAYYERVLDLDTVFRHIEAHALHADDLSVVKFGHPQNASDYLGPDRRADPRRVLRMYADGWTVALNKMQAHIPALAVLCQAAEAIFSAPFQTNLYLTPLGAQGFKPHWDTHDVFVLQVSGSKAWTIFDTKIALPLVGQSFDNQNEEPGPIADSFVLRAGDMLYCPRGLMHAAQSTDDASLHITMGLMAKTWADLMIEAVAGASLANPALRRNLPAGYARDGFDRTEAAATFAALAANLTESVDFAAIFDQMRDRFVASRAPSVLGQGRQLAALDRVTGDTVAGVRPGAVFHTEFGEEALVLSFGASTLTLPSFTRETLAAALTGSRYRVADLPGDLDDDGKATLVRRLIAEGLVAALDIGTEGL